MGAIILIWALATLPQTLVTVGFTVVMGGVAGPGGRFTLMSRRWAIFGLTGVIGTFIVTRVIDMLDFPVNYAIMFLVLSLGGFLSFYFSQKIVVPDQVSPPMTESRSLMESLRNYISLVRANPVFASFASKRFVYFSAMVLAQPIMPLFFVREVDATDAQIGAITMTMTIVMLAGYYIWPPVGEG